jgi:hypothetical protein
MNRAISYQDAENRPRGIQHAAASKRTRQIANSPAILAGIQKN